MTDWQSWMTKLEAAGEEDADDLVDNLTPHLLASPPDPSARAVAVKALSIARSDLSVRSAAGAVAWVAPADDTEAVDLLEKAFEARRSNVFLAPSLLNALALLGLRNPSARAGAVRYLLRLKVEDPRPLLVAGVKAMGLLCDRQDQPELRAKVIALAGSADVVVRAEARQQIALLRLADALLAESEESLVASLAAAREAFRVAEESEEVRPDATLLRLLLDAVLRFGLERDRAAAATGVRELACQLREMGGRLSGDLFRMDRSPAAAQVAGQCAVVATALETAAGEVAEAVRWTNFDRSVVRLANCYGEIRYRPTALTGNEQVVVALSNVADRMLNPRLGPVLARKVGRESFEQVIRNYETAGGRQEVLAGLRALQRAALEAERVDGYQLSEETVGILSDLAARSNCTPDDLVRRFNVKIGANGGDVLALSTELLPATRGMKMTRPAVGIIVALAEEYDAVRLMLSNEKQHRADGPGGSREYLLGEIASTRKGAHQVVLAQTMAMGNNSAALKASRLLTDFDGIDAIIMCGIAGGVPHPESPSDHVRLGDVVVSNRGGVVQYDLGKDKGKEFEHRAPPNPPSARLLEAVMMLERDRLAGKRPWDDHIRAALLARSLSIPDPSTDVVLDKDDKPITHPGVPGASPRVFLGTIASANVVQGDYKKRDRLRDRFKVKAVEMEGSGVADATWEHEKGYLVVRGICDYCDVRTKSKQTDAWKRYAAIVAAAYVRALLEAIPGVEPAAQTPPPDALSDGARRVLLAAVTAKRQTVTLNSNMYGLHLGTGDGPIIDTDDGRQKAECRAWLDELLRRGLIADAGGKGQVFEVTEKGYRTADALRAQP